MSLLRELSYAEYKKFLEFSLRQCEIIAGLANLQITFNNDKKPGEQLIKALDRYGFSVDDYFKLISKSQSIVNTYYKPKSKVAILVGNDRYQNLPKLATPSVDCDSLAENLLNLGFIVVTIKNTTSVNLREILTKVFGVLEEDSYCFFFYGGHGCQLSNIKCILGIDCPTANIQLEHCVTENFILKEVEKRKQDLCILVMDTCRMYLDRKLNPEVYSSIHAVEDYSVYNNLLIIYSTQTAQCAYEMLQIECSTTMPEDVTYELKTGDTSRIIPGASQYVNVLCNRIMDDLEVTKMFDGVHEDIEDSRKKQRPIKVQCGVQKRSLYDPTTGDIETLVRTLTEATKDDTESCNVLSPLNS